MPTEAIATRTRPRRASTAGWRNGLGEGVTIGGAGKCSSIRICVSMTVGCEAIVGSGVITGTDGPGRGVVLARFVADALRVGALTGGGEAFLGSLVTPAAGGFSSPAGGG